MGVGKRLCADPAVEDHRSLCNAAARVVGGICHRYGVAYTNLQPRITKALFEAVADSARPLSTQYGAMVAIAEVRSARRSSQDMCATARTCAQLPPPRVPRLGSDSSLPGYQLGPLCVELLLLPLLGGLTARFEAAAESKGSDDAPVGKKPKRSRKEAPKAPKSAVAVATAGEARACQAALHAAVRRLPIQLARVCMCVSLCGPKPRCCTPDAHPMHTCCTPAAHLPCFRSGCTFVISTGGLKSPRSKQQLCRLRR